MDLEEQFTPSKLAAGFRAYSVPHGHIVPKFRLDANEGQMPFDIARYDLSALEASQYPSREGLTRRIAKEFALPENQVLITAGGDDALERACRVMLEPGNELIFPAPSFEMIARYAKNLGATLREISWFSGGYPTDAVAAAISPKTAAIAVVSPNNPSGAVISAEDLKKLSRLAPKALLLVDLAYTEFAEEDLTSIALTLPNAVVFRTFSKAWSLASCRVGYALGPAAVISWMNAAGNPYPVSGQSLAIAEQSLNADQDRTKTFVQKVKADRSRMEQFLKAQDIEFSPSQGNFVFARVPRALWVWESLAASGIAIRRFPDSDDPLRKELSRWLRITCPGDPRITEHVLSVIERALSPEAILICTTEKAELPSFESNRVIPLLRAESVSEGMSALNRLPAKPSAARIWVLTDSVKTTIAAREAGCLPLGFAFEPKRAAELLESGAARIFSNMNSIQEVLP